jgi:hypothetical protein
MQRHRYRKQIDLTEPFKKILLQQMFVWIIKVKDKSMEKVIHKITNKQQTSDFHYWQNQSPVKRLEALEQIRQEYHQYRYSNAQLRLQRIYTIIKRKPS